jgi:uncharacterized protein YjbJ (UPF0337 family)
MGPYPAPLYSPSTNAARLKERTMSTSDSTVKGKFDEVVGNVKQGFGEAVGSEKIANEGTGQQVKGHAEQAWGAVKEGFTDKAHDEKPVAEAHAHDVREKITSTAQNVKESIQDAFRDKKAS